MNTINSFNQCYRPPSVIFNMYTTNVLILKKKPHVYKSIPQNSDYLPYDPQNISQQNGHWY